MFKAEPLFSSAQSSGSNKNLNNLLADDGEEGEQEPPGLIQQFLNFWSKLWSPSTSDAEKLGWSYVYAEDGSLLGEYGSGGSASSGTSQYLYLPTASGPMPIAAIIKGQTYAIHSDHLNTPRKLTQADGQAAWQWAYSAFGEEQPTTGAKRFTNETTTPNTGAASIPEVTFNLRYPGQYFDSETKLHYNHFRSYSPGMGGRYTQFDPIGLDGGPNGFLYASANPLSFVDPDGLQFLDLTTFAGLRRETTLDDAVRAGAWTRAVTLPAVTAGLTPSAIGLVGSASAPLFCAAPETITVSRWGREGLEAGDWVMKGGVNRWNYARSFKWERTPWNQSAPYSTGTSYQIPSTSLATPTGWEAFKTIFGQRIYKP